MNTTESTDARGKEFIDCVTKAFEHYRRGEKLSISLKDFEDAYKAYGHTKRGDLAAPHIIGTGLGVWQLATEKPTTDKRMAMISGFWGRLIDGLKNKFGEACDQEQWEAFRQVCEVAQIARAASNPEEKQQHDQWLAATKQRWIDFVNRLAQPPIPSTPGVPSRSLNPAVTAALGPYRRHIISQFREVSLSGFGGVGAESDAEGKAELAKVYIDLDVRSVSQPGAEARAEMSGHEASLRSRPGPEKAATIPALEWLAGDPRRVLIGLPGSGKSTLLKFFSLCLAHCGLTPDAGWLDHLKLWPKEETDLIPIFVELRQFAASLPAKLPAVDGGQHLTNYILAQLKPSPLEECAAALKTALATGRAIVFLDGLDEVPDDDQLRRFVLDTVEAFARGPFKESRMVVTCRPRSYDDPAWQLQGFEKTELAALDTPKIERFIDQFYTEVSKHNQRVADVKADRIAKLKLAVRRDELQELAANPFMLTVMAWLHRFEELPKKRAPILHRLVEQLLFKWEETKLRDDAIHVYKLSGLLQAHDLEVTSLRRVLCRLAFQARQAREHVHASQGAAFAVSISKSKLLAELEKLPPADKVSKDNREKWALQVIHVIDRRTGLLVPEGGDSFTMPYKLQEFLAGEHLTDRDELEALAEALKLPVGQCGFDRVVAQLVGDNGYWEEVVKWAAAIHAHVKNNKGEARDLAHALCDTGAPTEAAAVRRAVVAGEILWEIGVNEVANTRHGPACLDHVRITLDGFMRRGRLALKQRAAAGVARGWLEGLPKGVGLNAEVPDIEWIKIPAGKFTMGGPENWQGGTKQPYQCGLIKEAYRISRYPVTVEQFGAFVKDKGYEQEKFWNWSKEAAQWLKRMKTEWHQKNKTPGPEDSDPVFQTPNHPRVGVNWFEAVAFCHWLNEKMKDTPGIEPGSIRLPSEAEWERAARGPKGRAWPWEGDEGDLGQRCNCHQSGIGHTSAVGLFPTGDTPKEAGHEQGVADLAGNVWEWCCTSWLKDYANYETNVRDELEGNSARVLRGGSWYDGREVLSPSFRSGFDPGLRGDDVGFGWCVWACPLGRWR